MARRISAFEGSLVIAGLVFFAFVGSGIAQNLYGAPPPNLNAHLDKLVSSYPDWIAGYDSNSLILKNGLKFPLSDHRTDKPFEELIERSDVEDMFYVPYPAGAEPRQPPKNFDPGRARFEPLLLAMYGDCTRNEVLPKLRTIDWLSAHGGGRVAVTTVNGADKALEAVSQQLDRLPTAFMKYLVPTAGTYNCRVVAGSRVKSMHAYGAAIDLNARYSDYWRWSPNLANPIWKNRIPAEVVRIFEKQGFIWGGRWYHFDTMHFEYRPELL